VERELQFLVFGLEIALLPARILEQSLLPGYLLRIFVGVI
jgi:hypothetical protein